VCNGEPTLRAQKRHELLEKGGMVKKTAAPGARTSRDEIVKGFGVGYTPRRAVVGRGRESRRRREGSSA